MKWNKSTLRPYLVMAIALFFAVGTFLTTRADVSAMRGSSIAGLAVMKDMARQSIPYNVALDNRKPTLLEFYANWCTTCQSMAPILSKLHQQYGKRVNFVMLDIDDPQWAKPMEQYHVTGVPQLTFLEADRTVVNTEIGRVPEAILHRLFEQFLS